MNTSEGTGVSSCGWIMERMEGRWPSLAPTKNSLRTEGKAVGLGRGTQAGGERTGPVLRTGLPAVGLGVPHGASWQGALPPPAPRRAHVNPRESLDGHRSCVTSGQERVLFLCHLNVLTVMLLLKVTKNRALREHARKPHVAAPHAQPRLLPRSAARA